MTIAIVGTSHLTDSEKNRAWGMIAGLLCDFRGQVITGDADGIDSIVLEFAEEYDVTMIKALDKTWEGKYGYKQRNIKIAEMADIVYSISTRIKETRCYHCDTPNHERTGGCWTKRFAINKLGKQGKTIVI